MRDLLRFMTALICASSKVPSSTRTRNSLSQSYKKKTRGAVATVPTPFVIIDTLAMGIRRPTMLDVLTSSDIRIRPTWSPHGNALAGVLQAEFCGIEQHALRDPRAFNQCRREITSHYLNLWRLTGSTASSLALGIRLTNMHYIPRRSNTLYIQEMSS